MPDRGGAERIAVEHDEEAGRAASRGEEQPELFGQRLAPSTLGVRGSCPACSGGQHVARCRW
ncbi:MAG: hypothetical protein M3332_12460 [Actinomycetota bacterium]|nr:hypothetical protein [Actinomycetota bacterium]